MGTFLSVKANRRACICGWQPAFQVWGSDPVILLEAVGSVPAHKKTPEAGARGAILLITYYVLEILIFKTATGQYP